MRKIAFFDIDGTLTSEIDGHVPLSAAEYIEKARKNGHLMFINTGRCFQNVEKRFRDVGFDGYVCGCGTNVYCDNKEILYNRVDSDVIHSILNAAKMQNIDILFESRDEVVFDRTRPITHPQAIRQLNSFISRGYDMDKDPSTSGFSCDKFVIWYENDTQLKNFRKVSDEYFDCIDRGGTFREFVPHGFSKATGIQTVLDYYNLPLDKSYAFGDSNNDLSMLSYVPNSVAMGNTESKEVLSIVKYTTTKASEDGIKNALIKLGFV